MASKGIEKRLDDAHFARVRDPRRAASVVYSLPAILYALVAAVVTGARSLRQLEQRTVQIVKKLGSWKGLKKRIADNTFSTLLPRLRLPDLLACLHRMVKAEHRRGNLKPTRLPVGTVAIDGKHVATLHWHDLSCLLKAEQAKQAKQVEQVEQVEQDIAKRLEPTAENVAQLRELLSDQVQPW